MIKTIDDRIKENIRNYINDELTFKNIDEKEQFMEFLDPVLNNEISESDLIKMRFKNKQYFTQIISKFELNHNLFAYKLFNQKYTKKAPLFILWLNGFRNSFLTLVFLSFLFSLGGNNKLSFILSIIPYILAISAIWGVKETFYQPYFSNQEDIRIKFLEKYAKNSFIAQFVYLIDKYKKPLSNKFINTTKKEIMEDSGSHKAVENRFKSNIIDGNVYSLNSLSLTRNNLMNLKKLISYANQDFYKSNIDIKREDSAKKIISKL